MGTPAEVCVVVFPGLGVRCQVPVHPVEVAHWASGLAGGQRFSVFWWGREVLPVASVLEEKVTGG